jgi:peptide/nickel transport system permease protein
MTPIIRKRGPWGKALRHGSFVIGAALTGLLVVAALVGLVWTPWPNLDPDLPNRLQPPSATHWLGTDHLGRDMLSMLMVGARTSIVVGIIAVSIGMTVGVALGAWAAARRGWVEEMVMRFTDLSFAFPVILTAIMIVAILGPGTANAILAIGIYNIPIFARMTRGAANAIWQREFVMASRASGKGDLAITLQRILPNIAAVIIVQATIQFAIAILAEAALSFLGLGPQPPQPSWGRMLHESQTFTYMAPHIAIFPGLAVVLSVLGVNLLGDGLRDLLDPKLARSRGA